MADIPTMLKLIQEQTEALQRGFGHIYSDTRNLASLARFEVGLRNDIQTEVNHIIQGSLLVYLFAMWDEHGMRNLEDRLPEDLQIRLKAFRHLRHCAGHGYRGTRAKDHKKLADAFEEVMSSQEKLNIEWDRSADTVDFSTSRVAIDCQRFMTDACKKILVSVAGSGPTS